MDNFLTKYQEQLKYVSSIVDYSKEYAKSLEEKSQINHKTKEFREKHEKDFTSLIKLSEQRYKSVKSGNYVSVIMNKQKRKLNKIIFSVAKDEVYKSDEILRDVDKINKNMVRNGDIHRMRLKLTNRKAFSNEINYNKLYRRRDDNSNILEKNHLLISDALNNLDNDKRRIEKEFTSYYDHINEKSCKLNTQTSGKVDMKVKGFNDFFSNNYSSLSFKTKPAIRTKVIKKNEKFNEFKLVKMIDQKKLDDQNLIKVKSENVFDDIDVKNFAEKDLKLDKKGTINYVKNEVKNSINRIQLLKEKEMRLGEALGEENLPKIESYDNLIKKFLTTKSLVSKPKVDEAKNEIYKNKKKNALIENERNKFFKDIARCKKVPITFIDEYTKREDFNQRNNEINKIVGSNRKLDVKKMNKTIEDYFSKTPFFLTSNVGNQVIKRTMSEDTKDKVVLQLDDPRYSIDYLEPKQINIFAKTSEKLARTGYSLDRESMVENYNNFLKRKEDLINKELGRLKKNDSKSVEIKQENLILDNTHKITYSSGFNSSLSHPFPILRQETGKILETVSKFVNERSNNISFKSNHDSENSIPLLKKNMKNSFYNFDTRVSFVKLDV